MLQHNITLGDVAGDEELMDNQATNDLQHPPSPWPHRLAWVQAGAVFVLILAGSTVTSYQAGTAVEDWPTTHGYWVYPPLLWMGAAGDFFLECGHRLAAQLVGLVSVVLAAVCWRLQRRRCVRWLAAAAVAAIVLQASIGGLRVIGGKLAAWLQSVHAPDVALLGDELLLRKLHVCTAALFLALCAALVTLTSPRWMASDGPQQDPAARRLQRLALAALVGNFLLIVLAAGWRHLPCDGRLESLMIPPWMKFLTAGLMTTRFEFWVWSKLLLCGLMLVALPWLLIYTRRNFRGQPMLVRRAGLLTLLLVLQLILGAGAWVTHYNWPGWFIRNFWAVDYVPLAEGPLQVLLSTAHAATGPLSLAVSLSLVLWSRRLLRRVRGDSG